MRNLRRVTFWLLVLELIAAFATGTWLRIKLEQPVRYIGSALPASPHLVGDAGTPVLDPRQHEEQVT